MASSQVRVDAGIGVIVGSQGIQRRFKVVRAIEQDAAHGLPTASTLTPDACPYLVAPGLPGLWIPAYNLHSPQRMTLGLLSAIERMPECPV